MPLSYEVTIRLDDEAMADALEQYMVGRHVGEVFATGCFLDARFERSESHTFRSRYTVASREELDRYINEHSARLREDFARHFPAGVSVIRAVWDELAAFGSAAN